MKLVVIIIELHNTSLEWVLLVDALLLLSLTRRHQHTFLEEVGGDHDRISIEFTIVFNLCDTVIFVLTVGH